MQCLEVSGAVRLMHGSLGIKGLIHSLLSLSTNADLPRERQSRGIPTGLRDNYAGRI